MSIKYPHQTVYNYIGYFIVLRVRAIYYLELIYCIEYTSAATSKR